MRMLLVTSLLLALPGVPHAEGGTPPAQAEKPAKAQKARGGKGSGAKAADAKADAKAEAAKTDQKGKDGAKGSAAPDQKPCEPVKPCPID